jgi:hypothetical protein
MRRIVFSLALLAVAACAGAGTKKTADLPDPNAIWDGPNKPEVQAYLVSVEPYGNVALEDVGLWHFPGGPVSVQGNPFDLNRNYEAYVYVLKNALKIQTGLDLTGLDSRVNTVAEFKEGRMHATLFFRANARGQLIHGQAIDLTKPHSFDHPCVAGVEWARAGYPSDSGSKVTVTP